MFRKVLFYVPFFISFYAAVKSCRPWRVMKNQMGINRSKFIKTSTRWRRFISETKRDTFHVIKRNEFITVYKYVIKIIKI